MKVNPATSNDYDIVANHQFAEIRKDRETGQQVLFALRSFRKGEKISPLGAAFVSDKPSYLTVQTGNKTHIALHPYFLQYINHGCNPNCFFDTTKMEVTALRDIEEGEEFTFFYPCLLYTSDAADERSSVDLGGRRIIKKKKKY